MSKFLFELGTEEIPAWMIEPALQQMESSLCGSLRELGLDWKESKAYASPRRLAFILEGLPSAEPDREELTQGPPVSVAVGPGGQPTPAGIGFAKKMGMDFKELEQVETEKGLYLALRRRVPGRPLPEILVESVEAAVRSLSWPKNMVWDFSRFRFIRPIRWLVLLWDDQVLEWEFEGVAAGRTSRGHRFLGSPEVTVDAPDRYLEALRHNYVLADVCERRAKIERELKESTPAGLSVKPDSELMSLVAYLNEYPTVLRGSFEERFLEIPQEVLITVMRHHQKYFALVDSDGRLQPYFLTVLNTNEDGGEKIRQGHERVLRARLEDGEFFWRQDLQRPLSSRVQDLDKVLFQKDLGSYLEKTRRLEMACRELGGDRLLLQAARLCKADLTTQMVGEMPELQGIMGGLYAREEGHPEEVWKAIYEHYRPTSLEEESPSTETGALLSVADKMDTIVGCFAAGIRPTGSSDPFALRRQAQGVVKVLLDRQLSLPLSRLIEVSQDALGRRDPALAGEVTEFLRSRVRFIFQEKGLRYDVLNAIFAGAVDLVDDAWQRGQAVTEILSERDFEALAAAFKRMRNILKQQEAPADPLLESRLVEPAEKDLYSEFAALRPQVEESVARKAYLEALRLLAGLGQVVDRFFDEVMVMAEDAELRDNRLRLLTEISDTFLEIADISEIVGRD